GVECYEADGESQSTAARRARSQRGGHNPDAQSVTAWVGGVLQAGRYQAGTGRMRWMATAQVALCSVAAMEAALRASTQLDEARANGRAGMALGEQSTRSLVERGRESHACCFPEVLVRSFGAGVAACYRTAPPAHFMNRRMRNRTYGGVGGRPG